MPSPIKVMLVGSFAPGALERSYESAFLANMCHVSRFDMVSAVRRNVRFGAVGARLNRFVVVEPWIAKANREMLLAVQQYRPDVVVVFGQNVVRAGALAQLRACVPSRLVFVWPDTMVFLSTETIQCLPLYDFVGTYSKASVSEFERLGARAVHWLPLAADPEMHARPVGNGNPAHEADVGFIGQWRPEREEALSLLLAHAPEVTLKIWGPDWGRRCKRNGAILRAWQGRPLFAGDFAAAVASCKIHLNLIDPTNFPAANMRFFELLVAGGFQISSSCPEMESVFLGDDSVVYFQKVQDLPVLVRRYVLDDAQRALVAQRGQDLVLQSHTYSHRVSTLLSVVLRGAS